jgi:hypothetical protein
VAVVGLVVDLAAADARRVPEEADRATDISGTLLPRLAVAAVLALLKTTSGSPEVGEK